MHGHGFIYLLQNIFFYKEKLTEHTNEGKKYAKTQLMLSCTLTGITMDWKKPPYWMHELDHLSKNKIMTLLRDKHLKKSFPNRAALDQYIKSLKWPWAMDWRPEQKTAIDAFFKEPQDIIVQAVFGSGKTTMMIAMIHIMLLHEMLEARHIQVLAFNVAIKNEIKKKIFSRSVNISTYDSLIYKICGDMGMNNIHLPNFEGKRRYVREHIHNINPRKTIRYVFVDESQDLEKPAYHILKKYFPRAIFVFIGDIFQSIQKEPRESLLWYLLQNPHPSRRVITMKITPRVPRSILREIRSALSEFYPEFRETIMSWKSANTTTTSAHIRWVSFASYQKVYDDLLLFCQEHKASDIMVLTFSSAITVRGSLGDVARVRKFLNSNGYQTNVNHKHMMDDRIFLSTANSSKGLERPHVFCFLSFPLEKAFSNFSDDLVMNIITVALTRAKEDVVIYVPSHKDRFSSSLKLYQKCPHPEINGDTTLTKTKAAEKYCDIYNMRDMLEQEHGVTELLRQNILSFETKQKLKSIAKRYKIVPIPKIRFDDFRTEEGSAFVGLLFESLILTTWTKTWPKSHCSEGGIPQHAVFHHFSGAIEKLRNEYNAYIHSHGCSSATIFKGSLLYSKLQLATHQKIFIRVSSDQQKQLYLAWQKLSPSVTHLCPATSFHNLKTQSNVAMQFVTGIADALLLPHKDSKELLEVLEIKASRSPEWMENALIQSILYGIMLGRSLFRIHLLNVLSNEALSYSYHLKGQLMEMRTCVQTDVAVWNLNCFLAKNVTHNDTTKLKLSTDGLFFVNGSANMKYIIGEMMSPSRFYLRAQDLDMVEMMKRVEKLHESGQMVHLIVGRHVDDQEWPLPFTQLRFSSDAPNAWDHYIQEIEWPILEESRMTTLQWDSSLATLCVQICDLCKKYNFV